MLVFSSEPLRQQTGHFRGRDVEPCSIRIRRRLVGKSGKPLDFYLLCFALEYDASLLKEFDADSCLLIREPNTFCARAEAACRKRFHECDFFADEVSYYDSVICAFSDQPLL